jgi:hypothetical protein
VGEGVAAGAGSGPGADAPAPGGATAWAGLAVLLALLAAGATAHAFFPTAYYRLSQEDGPVEWATVWSFAAAALLHARAALARGGLRRGFGALLAAFCLVVAAEEISWGQRLLGYRSPDYFLEHNRQQELTLHNAVEDAVRERGLLAVIVGYGVLLPLAVRWRPLRPLAQRFGVIAPPLALAPGFAATALLYAAYPWRFVGEWVELVLGVGLLATGAARPRALAAALAGVAAAGFATGPLLAAAQPPDPERVEAARRELAALHEDWSQGRLRTDCGLHRRLYHVVEEEGQAALRSGRFATLSGLPEERARFFLDPWSSPYWVMDRCEEDGARRIRVYSMGPNRRRDSVPAEVLPDDLAETILEWSPEAEEGP